MSATPGTWSRWHIWESAGRMNHYTFDHHGRCIDAYVVVSDHDPGDEHVAKPPKTERITFTAENTRPA